MSRAVVFGGYGTFGSQVARELARLGIAITVAGRNGRKAEVSARQLGSSHGAAACDVTQAESCGKALAGHTVAVNCAGPFAFLGPTLLESCLKTGIHYVDITDDRRYAKLVRSLGEQFAGRKLAAVYGCSSLPGISCSLALLACQGAPSKPERARLTLFIGNDNTKGPAAVRSVVGSLGNPIVTPQRVIHGFRDREIVWLTDAFGARSVFNIESPEYDLLPGLLGVSSVSVKAGFESRLATGAFALLAALGSNYGERFASVLAGVGKQAPRGGSSGGVVMAELFYAGGSCRRAWLLARRDGQRMVALPCAFVAEALCRGVVSARGALTAYEALGPTTLLDRLAAERFELGCEASLSLDRQFSSL